MSSPDLQGYDATLKRYAYEHAPAANNEQTIKDEDTSTEVEKESENTAEDKSLWETAMMYKDVYSGTFEGENFCEKQNYIAGQVMAGIFTDNGFPSVEEIDEMNRSWDTVNNAAEFQIISNDLSEEDNQKAMEIAIQMLESKLAFTKSEIPEYGDCKDYYNNGNLTDWILTHPVGIGLDKLAEATNWEWYQNVKENYISKDGMFTLQNIPGYIWGKEGEDDWTDILTIKSTDSIIHDVEKQEELLEQLRNSTDNPEEFAQIYHQLTNGINFDAEKVLNYSNNSGEDITETEIVGRNYTYEEIGKNRLGTNILFEVNKTVGTKLCQMIPAGGPVIAYGVNVGVSILDNETAGENENKKSTLDILGEEAIRTFCVSKGGDIKEQITGKTGSNKWTTNSMFASGKGYISTTVNDATNIIDTVDGAIKGENVSWGSAIVSATNIFVVPGWKSSLAALGKGISNFKFW